MNDTEKNYTDFALPPSVVNKLDVSHLVDEVERVDNSMTEAEIREKAGAESQAAPVLSEQLTDFLSQNNLRLGNSHERSELVKQLHLLKDNVPVIHMTFAVTADRESLSELAAWLRGSVHPQAVIAAGLQPSLVAGVYLRTSNRVHDFSMRAALSGHHDALARELEALRGAN